MSGQGHHVICIAPGTFDNYLHWYPKALNTDIHPLVKDFLGMSNASIADRYCQMHPSAQSAILNDLLSYKAAHYRWAGADLINVTNAGGKRQMVLIENNSCPSGQKSMPRHPDQSTQCGYRELMELSFKPFVNGSTGRGKGVLAVFYDKNFMETSGYASAMADVFNEPVYLVAMQDKANPHIRHKVDRMEVQVSEGHWEPVAAAFRYVTQKPWNRLPLYTSTKIYNPVVTCLAGGRNKMMAAKAYEALNRKLKHAGLKIVIPETIRNVNKEEIPERVDDFGGRAVVKIPYSNAGQGVFTITNARELTRFMKGPSSYEKYIVQSLIGHSQWSTKSHKNRFYHLGTLPDQDGHSFVFDLRVMICSTPEGFRPVSLYSRRAEKPFTGSLSKRDHSWSILGTNLSSVSAEGEWTTDTNRLMLMDRHDFNRLGLGLDDLIEAYVQSVLSTIAIDQMSERLINKKGRFRRKLFASMNPDSVLLSEIPG